MKTLTTLCIAFLLAAQATAQNKYPTRDWNRRPTALPPNDDSTWKATISITRTDQVTGDSSNNTDPTCPKSFKASRMFTLNESLSSERLVGVSNGDEFTLHTSVDDLLKRYTTPLSGSASTQVTFHSEDNKCDWHTTTAWSGNAKVTDASKIFLSFSYDQSKRMGDFMIGSESDAWTGTASGTEETTQPQGHFTTDISDKAKADVMRMTHYLSEFTSSPGNPGTITPTNSGYEVTWTESTSAGGGTENTTVHISLTHGAKPQYDAILTAVGSDGSSYDNYIPTGPLPDQPWTTGNGIGFSVQLVDKNTGKKVTGVDYDVLYTLTDVSNEPGYCLNYPMAGADTKPDFRFDSLMRIEKDVSASESSFRTINYTGLGTTVYVDSYDYGGHCTVTATVFLKFGPPLTAHFAGDTKTTIAVPRDDNRNGIADAWEKQQGIFGKNYAHDWDGEQTPGNSHDGDGFTLYEEYRGLIVQDKERRMNPAVKEVFVASDGYPVASGIAFFTAATKGQILPVLLKAGGEFNTTDKVVNRNTSSGHKQHGVYVEEHDFQDKNDPEQVMGQVFPQTNTSTGSEPVASSPGDVDYLGMASDLAAVDRDYTFAHEFAHCLGVQHHGNAAIRTFSSLDVNFLTGDHPLWTLVNEDGSPGDMAAFKADLAKAAALKLFAAMPGSQACGDVNCIMCYNRDFKYSFPNGDKGSQKVVVCDDKHANGTTFCTSAGGTGRNDPHRTAGFSVFGDGATSCIAQFKVRDDD